MNHTDAIAILQAHFTQAVKIDAANEGNKFDVLIVDDSFEGKRLVQRQQAVYALFNHHIANGTIHALSIHTLTPAEYQAKS